MTNEELNNKPAEQEELEVVKPVEQEVKEEELQEVNGGACRPKVQERIVE